LNFAKSVCSWIRKSLMLTSYCRDLPRGDGADTSRDNLLAQLTSQELDIVRLLG
jgi:hypothetical protein